MTNVFIRERSLEKKKQVEGSNVNIEAETGVMLLQVRGTYLDPPEAGRGRKDSPLETLEGIAALPTS